MAARDGLLMAAKEGPVSRVREARFDDYEGVMALRNRHGMTVLSRDEWMHFYTGSPLLKERNRSWPIGWVVEASGEIKGYLGNIPLKYHLESRTLVAAAMNAWAVDPECRPKSLFLMRAFYQQPGVDLFLNTTANENASRTHDAMRISRVPGDDCDLCLYWITHTGGFAASATRKLGWPVPEALLHSAGAVVDAAQKAVAAWRSRRMDRSTVSFARLFDERFDGFWAERKRLDGRLAVERDSATLNWIFSGPIARGEVWTVTATSGGRLSAYGIFLKRSRPEVGLSRMRLVDLQVEPAATDQVGPIMAAALDRCRRERIHVLEAASFNAAKRAMLEPLKPHQRRLGAWPFYYKAADNALTQRLQRAHLWDPCELDGDGCF